MKYDHMAVFIRHDSGEIWGFRYELTLCIGILIIMASTGVLCVKFVLSRALLSVTRKHKALF
jgi:hypothetical protein